MFDPSKYGLLVHSLLVPERVLDLGPGTPNELLRATLASLSIERLFEGHGIANADMARCCLAGLWLLHDFLDESHAISQAITSAEGSYWHAIMHRREPDAGNAKYWFRRVGKHPVMARLAVAAADVGYGDANEPWSSARFIDGCEAERDSLSERELSLRLVQQREWRLLFEWCWTRAIGQLGH